ncbi:TRAP transporter substrate-binding protein [Rhodoferax sp.]|uniref:TRAP transporter substrate-binding protein n=1 Tax=Rhodoferax sp. TaxID=50421 RepID=UPI0025EF48CF|nr:TRAP transporter substrate-binding protein [Rhodoferax sp.]
MHNRNFISVSFWVSRLLVAVLASAAPVVQAQPAVTVLKLNHTDTPSGSRHAAAEAFAQKVEEYTGGRYRILVFHSGQLGNDPQNVKAVAEGRLDFTTSATGSFAGLVNELNLTALPYLVDSYEHGWRLYDNSTWLAKQFDKLPAKGIRYLATWEAGFRSFTTKTPLNQPADAKGKRIRVFPNDMIKWIMESIGYEPVVLPITNVYSAIQSGAVDGQENPVDTIRSMRFYEVAPNIVLTQHVYSPIPFVMSETLWQRLSAADRQRFMKAGQEASNLSRTLTRDADEANIAAMKADGAKVVVPNRQQFRQAMEGVYPRARTVYGADVDAILADAKAMRP